MSKKLTFIDLFAGIGGFRLGFEKAGYKCVFSSENNKYCQETYYNNFNEIPFGDIRNLNSSDIPDFDILCAGFPCQPFSIAGEKKGFEDTRGTLFFEICRIIDTKQPKTVILENVKHLYYHDNKRTFKTMLRILNELNYKVSYNILNAKDFGVPQNRERLFIIAQKDSYFDFNLLQTKNSLVLKDFLDVDCFSDFLSEDEYTLIDVPVKQKSGLIFMGYRNKKIRQIGVRPNTEHLSRVHKQPNRIYSIEGTHPTIPSQEPSGRFFIYLPKINKVRRMTLDECYHIMGFPKTFKKHPILTECYKQIGNSVCVPLIEEIALSLKGVNCNTNESQRKVNGNLQPLIFN